MQQPRIWLVEDEMSIADTLVYQLQQEGFIVTAFERGLPALDAAHHHQPALAILDVGLPDISGFELCRRLLARYPALPVLFLTARSEEVDKLLGLEIGADDYITKPFNPRELTIRARNLLSRTMNLGTVSEERRSVDSYKFNGWELDINSRSLISPNGEQYKLPRSEFRAMLHFCENPGKIQSRAELLKKMTGRELKPHDRTVDVTIRRIRKHFESTPDTPEIIATIHGEGYRFCGDLQE